MNESIAKKISLALACVCLSVGVAAVTTACGETPVENYTVTFDANGGVFADNSTVQSATTDANGKVVLPFGDPVREDYDFVGYNTKSDGTGTQVTESVVYTADATVFANWQAVASENEETAYYFEAEYTDLTNLTGDLGSGTAYGREMIVSGERAHEGYYVDNFNVVGSSITYKINSDAASAVSMKLLIGALSEDTMDSDLLTVKVNGNKVNYAAGTVTSKTEAVSAIKTVVLFEEFDIGEIDLVAGENIITLTEGEKTNASGSGTYKLSLRLDAMILLSSDASLTWDPVSSDEWDSFYAF